MPLTHPRTQLCWGWAQRPLTPCLHGVGSRLPTELSAFIKKGLCKNGMCESEGGPGIEPGRLASALSPASRSAQDLAYKPGWGPYGAYPRASHQDSLPCLQSPPWVGLETTPRGTANTSQFTMPAPWQGHGREELGS